jgi:hypothetical protein
MPTLTVETDEGREDTQDSARADQWPTAPPWADKEEIPATPDIPVGGISFPLRLRKKVSSRSLPGGQRAVGGNTEGRMSAQLDVLKQ